MNIPTLQKIQLKNFRCFNNFLIEFDSPVTLLYGLNGSGKTSLLEALYYTCYLKSFRTHNTKDLIHFDNENFFIKAFFNNEEIHIGYTENKRSIKVNQKTIISYKELYDFYKIICITQDDLGLVQDGPELRRLFLNQALFLLHPHSVEIIKKYNHILDQRNKLLQSTIVNIEQLAIWTKALWQETFYIQTMRIQFLSLLQESITESLKQFFDATYSIKIAYAPKKNILNSWEEYCPLWEKHILPFELKYRRTLFGAHLDDFSILFQDKPARLFSSRGQQKLIVMLFKLGFAFYVKEKTDKIIMVIDDFLTEFDPLVADKLISICLSLKIQLIFTAPVVNPEYQSIFKQYKTSLINLSDIPKM